MLRVLSKYRAIRDRLTGLASRGLPALIVALCCLLPPALSMLSFTGMLTPELKASLRPALYGYVRQPANPSATWWSHGPQKRAEGFIEAKLQLRPWLIRLNNQLDYWLLHFSRMYASSIIIGRNEVLLEKAYVQYALGYVPLLPEETIRAQALKLKRLEAALAKRGIALLVLGTPGKISFFRDAVPSSFPEVRPDEPRNYDRLVKIFKVTGLPFVDGKQVLLESPLRNRGPFFVKGGTHWTTLAAFAALKTPVEKILAEKSGQPAKLVLDRIDRLPHAAGSDRDLLNLLNLLVPEDTYPTTRITAHLEGQPLKKKLVVLGSSFGRMIFDVLQPMRIAPKTVQISYLKYIRDCHCLNRRIQPGWPHLILKDSDAVIIEVNEAAYFAQARADDYTGRFADTLLQRLAMEEGGAPQAQARINPEN